MERVFNFRLYNETEDVNVAVMVPETAGNRVLTSACRPSIPGNPLIFLEATQIDTNEFIEDCCNLLYEYKLNNLNLWEADSMLDAITNVVQNHIAKHGRIFFGDLLCYMDDKSLIEVSLGRSIEHVKLDYALMVGYFVDTFGDAVKESIGPAIPFSQSNRYRMILNYAHSLLNG